MSRSSNEGTPKVGRKRKRVTMETPEHSSSQAAYDYSSKASAKGAIEIQDTDPEGKFVKLFNTGTEVGMLKIYFFIIL